MKASIVEKGYQYDNSMIAFRELEINVYKLTHREELVNFCYHLSQTFVGSLKDNKKFMSGTSLNI